MQTETLASPKRMTQSGGPPVSMGMPVFNGGRYLEAALHSLLNQTFDDFELVISDNASTDDTATVCRDLAADDPRIHYVRQPENRGFWRNQNEVFRLCRGSYFLATHHDDLRAPTYLEKTHRILEEHAEITVCYTATRDIDEEGAHLPRVEASLRMDSPSVRMRFADIIRRDHLCEPGFGLIRMSSLERTRLIQDYADSDRVFLAELALRGPFHRIPEVLFFRRVHEEQSTAVAPDRASRTVWFNPELEGKLVFPFARQLRGYWDAVGRAPISPRERRWCRRRLLTWCRANARGLREDAERPLRRFLRPVKRRLMGSGDP